MEYSMISIEEWARKQLSIGKSNNEICRDFIDSGFATSYESFLEKELTNLESIKIDEKQIKNDLADFSKVFKLDLIENLVNEGIRFEKTFGVSAPGESNGLFISIGQNYRRAKFYSQELNMPFNELFNALIYSTVGHEFGHRVSDKAVSSKIIFSDDIKASRELINKYNHDSEIFAETFAQLFTEYCGLNYGLIKKCWEWEQKYIQDKNLNIIVGFINDAYPLTSSLCLARGILYNVDYVDRYLKLYPKNEIERLLDIKTGTITF